MTQHITVRDKNSDAYAIVHVQTNPKFATMVSFYRSARVKNPERFLTRDVENSLKRKFEFVATRKKEKEAYRAARKVERNVAVGDILYTSYGWEATHVTFYRVVKLVGQKSVKLERIGNNYVTGGGLQGKVAPDLEGKGELIDRNFRVNEYGVNVKNHTAYKWEGKPVYYNSLD